MKPTSFSRTNACRQLYTTLILFLTATAWITAQPTLDWVRHMGGLGGFADATHGLAYDAEGNLFTTGSFQGTATFSDGDSMLTTISNGASDIFIASHTANGNIRWAVGIGGELGDQGNSITTDLDGNVYVTGSFKDSVNFGTETDPIILNAVSLFSASDIFLAKFNNNGEILWAKQFGNDGNDEGTGITLGADNHLYVCGIFRDSVNFNTSGGADIIVGMGNSADVFIAKFNLDGDIIWVKGTGGQGLDHPRSIATDGENNVVISGSYNGTIDLDPSADSATFPSQMSHGFLAKYSPVGDYLWAHSIGGSSFDQAHGVAVDPSGNIFVSGNFWGTIDLDSGLGESQLTSNANSDVFLAKYSPSGENLWAINFGGDGSDEGRGLTTDPLGNVYITGSFAETVDFNPSGNTYELESNGFYDIFTAKYNPDGNFLWAFNAGSTNSCYGHAIAHNGDNVLSIGGEFIGTASFDPYSEDVSIISFSGRDAFLARYADCATTQEHITAVICAGDSYELAGQTFSEMGIYVVEYADIEGCPVTSELELDVVDPDPAVLILTNSFMAVQDGAAYQWYECTGEPEIIEGATAQEFFPEFPANYQVEVILGNCSVWSDCIAHLLTDVQIRESLRESIELFPNPASDYIVIKSSRTTPLNIWISNSIGQQVAAQQVLPGENIISVNGFAKGYYIIDIRDSENVLSVPLIVE